MRTETRHRQGVDVVFAGGAPVAGRMRLLCFPHAGGGSSAFADWSGRLEYGFDVGAVRLPGRETRLPQRPFSDLAALLPVLGEALAPHLTGPFALFGHSMGAVVAFELTRWLRARGAALPAHLFVSARPAPHVPPSRPPAHLLPEDEFLARVGRLGGTPAEVLADPRLMALLLPTLRADFALVESYRSRDAPALACPITACGGVDDPDAGRPQLLEWRQYTTGPFAVRMFPGGHFYPRQCRPALLGVIADTLGTAPAA